MSVRSPDAFEGGPALDGSGALLSCRASLLGGAGVLGGTPSIVPLPVGTVRGAQ
ncbi:hypothetical protein ACIPX0_31085 [Streptomyces sp. NPDC090075]|uniref:hypothetical protein n=1 Tax=Streptomyces sp. NPDC090075 TaxID=3365937 RepID=UPI00383021EC